MRVLKRKEIIYWKNITKHNSMALHNGETGARCYSSRLLQRNFILNVIIAQ